MTKTSIKQKIILIVFGFLLGVVLLEIGLRIGGFVYSSLQENRNRVSLKKKGSYRIMCLGESTTAIGGEYSYPRQLEGILNQRDVGIKFSVINKGIPGAHTGSIIAVIEENLAKYKPDMVITMMGINDMSMSEIVPFSEDVAALKEKLSYKLFRVYKLINLLWLNITKAKEKGFYKSKEVKKNFIVKPDSIMQIIILP